MKQFYIDIGNTIGRFFGFNVQSRGWSIEAGFAVLILFMIVANLVYTTISLGGIMLLGEYSSGNLNAQFTILIQSAIIIKLIINLMGAVGFALLYPTTSLAKKWFAGLFAAAALGWDGIPIRTLPYKVLIIGSFILSITSPNVTMFALDGEWNEVLLTLVLTIPVLAVVFAAFYIVGYLLAFVFRKGHAGVTQAEA